MQKRFSFFVLVIDKTNDKGFVLIYAKLFRLLIVIVILPVRILIALVAGIAVGLVCYFAGLADFTATYLKPFGDIFVNLLKFIVVPVVLLSMIDGILSMGDMKQVGSVGVKTVAYFLCTTAIACVIGLTFANIFKSAGLFPILNPESAEYEVKETTPVVHLDAEEENRPAA